MGSFIGAVVLHTTDSDRGAAFWRDALGYVPREENAEFLGGAAGVDAAIPDTA